ncbi:MAG: hypothetical protein HRU50_09645 [Winogradskyella sp.]|uniref:DUF6733 family protein n=1 Tax=Winogradskyella sp. TaxID=1883156 RepID=UPI0025E2CE5E|nr:DUF6733 family protein [Winogradskyella sp.]NRB60181.1 hypothetical protein [Winogradskyella sp.]
MKKIFTLLFVMVAFSVFAQEESTDDKLSVGLSLNSDMFFGLNPMMTFSYDVSDTGSLTAYGIQWGAGTGSAWGQWTEFGLGYNFSAGDFDINPQLGFTFGSLLSSGTAQEGIIGDGIVPNLTVNYDTDQFEGQLYFGYYAALSDNTEAEQFTTNYLHYWLNFGYKATSYFSFGGHVETLSFAGGSVNGGGDLDGNDVYTGVGPYVQFTKGNAGMRLSFGANIADEDDGAITDDFYKLSFFVNL